jgi:hypothetical protein
LLQQQNHKSLWRELRILFLHFSSFIFWLQWWSLVCNANKLSFFVLLCSIIFV